ncbi:MAG TPA: enolase C-terminal domain-like protein [Iamia sp.]
MIVAAEVRRVGLPLLAPHVAAHGTEWDREVLLVRVVDDRGRAGWGECPTLSRPGYTAEWTGGAWDALRTALLPDLLAGVEPADDAPPMAAGAVRDALFDLDLHRRGEAPAPGVAAVPFGVAVGLAPSADEVVDEVEAALAAGARLVVLKIEPGRAVEPLAAVRARCPEVDVAVDANGSFDLADLDELRELDRLGPVFVEQPLPAADLEGSAQVAAALRAPIALDEAITAERDLAAAVSVEAGSIVTVKPARVGGFLNAGTIMGMARRAGWEVHVGGMLESGVGRAMARRLAAGPGVRGPGMVGPTGLLFIDDVVDPVTADADGLVAVATGPGLAPPPDPDRLARLTLDRWDAER